MKVWFPHVRTGSGTDVFTESLAQALTTLGCETVLSPVKHHYELFPWPNYSLPAPDGTDVVLANSWHAFPFRRPRTKLVVVEHFFVHDPAFAPYRSLPQAWYHRTAIQYYERASFRVADAIVAVSRYTADVVERAFGHVKVEAIHNGVDTSFFCPEAVEKALERGRPVRLLFVGNLTRRKGADLLPKIMRDLGPGYELHYTSGLRTRDSLTGMPGLVCLGRLDREHTRQAYRNADVLLFPTRLEGFGLAAVEAMACGTPVVASDTSALPEMIEDGVSGRLCPVDDVAAFAKAVRDLVGDRERYLEIARNARAVAVERFDILRMGRSYGELFRTLA